MLQAAPMPGQKDSAAIRSNDLSCVVMVLIGLLSIRSIRSIQCCRLHYLRSRKRFAAEAITIGFDYMLPVYFNTWLVRSSFPFMFGKILLIPKKQGKIHKI